jgi:hypothetical protein
MRYLFLIVVAVCVFSTTISAQKRVNAVKHAKSNSKNRSVKFIEGIEIKASPVSNIQEEINMPVNKDPQTPLSVAKSGDDHSIEEISSIQFKYAQLLNRNVENVKNIPLYRFIDEWIYTRYRYGGSGKNGIDCSALSGELMRNVFAIDLPRTAREQYNISSRIGKEAMQEGDLVFFNISRGISHVGVYLGDNYFVHASLNNGVIISSLEEPYYTKHFFGAGRVTGNDNATAIIN